jgi:hypothetical protein
VNATDIYFLYTKNIGPGRFELVYKGPELTCNVGAGSHRPDTDGASRMEEGGTPLDPETSYSFRVCAANGGGLSDFSPIVSFNTLSDGEAEERTGVIPPPSLQNRRRHVLEPLSSGDATGTAAGAAADGAGAGSSTEDGEVYREGGGATGGGSREEGAAVAAVAAGELEEQGDRTALLTGILRNGWMECWLAHPIVCCYYYHPATGVTQCTSFLMVLALSHGSLSYCSLLPVKRYLVMVVIATVAYCL